MSARARPAVRARVLEPVGVAVVAVERGGRRVELEDRLPESVGEGVDGRRLGVGQGHGRVSCGARRDVVALGVPRDGVAYRAGAAVALEATSETGASARARALDRRVEPEVRLEVGEVERVAGQERAQVVGLDDVPRPGVEGGPQQRRAGELVADELGPFRGDDQEADQVRRPAGSGRACAGAARRASPSTRPRTGSATLPRTYQIAVDLGELLDGRADARRGRARSSPASSRSPRSPPLAEPPRLLAPADPDPHPSRWPASAIVARRSVCSWLRRSRSSLVTIRSGVLARLR